MVREVRVRELEVFVDQIVKVLGRHARGPSARPERGAGAAEGQPLADRDPGIGRDRPRGGAGHGRARVRRGAVARVVEPAPGAVKAGAHSRLRKQSQPIGMNPCPPTPNP